MRHDDEQTGGDSANSSWQHIPHDGWTPRTQSSIPAHLRTEKICGAPRHLLAHATNLDLTGDDHFLIDEKRKVGIRSQFRITIQTRRGEIQCA